MGRLVAVIGASVRQFRSSQSLLPSPEVTCNRASHRRALVVMPQVYAAARRSSNGSENSSSMLRSNVFCRNFFGHDQRQVTCREEKKRQKVSFRVEEKRSSREGISLQMPTLRQPRSIDSFPFGSGETVGRQGRSVRQPLHSGRLCRFRPLRLRLAFSGPTRVIPVPSCRFIELALPVSTRYSYSIDFQRHSALKHSADSRDRATRYLTRTATIAARRVFTTGTGPCTEAPTVAMKKSVPIEKRPESGDVEGRTIESSPGATELEARQDNFKEGKRIQEGLTSPDAETQNGKHEIKRPYTIVGPLTLLLGVSLVTWGICAGTMLLLDNPEPVEIAWDRVRHDERVLSGLETRDPVRGWFWRGFVHERDARVKLQVYGANGKTGLAVCDLVKGKNGQWSILVVNFVLTSPLTQEEIAEMKRQRLGAGSQGCPVVTDDVKAAQMNRSVGIFPPQPDRDTQAKNFASGCPVDFSSLKGDGASQWVQLKNSQQPTRVAQ